MVVYKFGGASVKDSAGIRNLAKIVSGESRDLVIVVSAFGKTTNGLETLLNAWMRKEGNYKDLFDNIYNYHFSVAGDLFSSGNNAKNKLNNSFTKLEDYLRSSVPGDYDYEYDQIVSFGEVWSTIIVGAFLNYEGLETQWVDIRGNLITDNRFRDAGILWGESMKRIRGIFSFNGISRYVTQGFIGSTMTGQTSTLGREGSDYTAALLANMLDSEEVVVWKDVPGLLNADPKWLSDAESIDEVSYREAVEMTFSGAKVIHPKTIKPLHNKSIPLYVRSFVNPSGKGTVIKAETIIKHGLPVFVRKEDQILLSILPRDLSFVMGDNLSRIFYSFSRYGIKVNLVEASAVSIDVCIDNDKPKIDALIDDLKEEFTSVYNDSVEMLSIRHYTNDAISRITSGREILLEQRTRNSVRFVVRKS